LYMLAPFIYLTYGRRSDHPQQRCGRSLNVGGVTLLTQKK
jgi:hypothetical protein